MSTSDFYWHVAHGCPCGKCKAFRARLAADLALPDGEAYRRMGRAGDTHAETAYDIAACTFAAGYERDYLCRRIYHALVAVERR